VILGIDPGSKKIGLALLSDQTRPLLQNSRILPVGRMRELNRWLDRASLVVLERPNLKGLLTKKGRARLRFEKEARFFYDMAGLNLVYAQVRKMVVSKGVRLLEPLGYYGNHLKERTWLHVLTGLRRPSRSDVRAAIERDYGIKGSLQEDLLDALGLALYGYLALQEEHPLPLQEALG